LLFYCLSTGVCILSFDGLQARSQHEQKHHAICQTDKDFLCFTLHSSKFWHGSQFPDCNCMLLVHPTDLSSYKVYISNRNTSGYKTVFQLEYALLDYTKIQRLLCNTKVKLFFSHCLQKRIYKTESEWSQCIKRRIRLTKCSNWYAKLIIISIY
jgi:hypothetical protein